MSEFAATTFIRRQFQVYGIVQGVGFRPFVYALATRSSMTGFVRNDLSGVTIEVQGPSDQVARFAQSLQSELPPLARLDETLTADITVRPQETAFVILDSETAQPGSTPVSPDVAICPDCLAELRDATDRRYRYPFINCTHCGPRFTILLDTPYDRRHTTMAKFSMCPECQQEYTEPGDRRFHAQPIACPICGPTVWFATSREIDETRLSRNDSCLAAERAIDAFHLHVAQGQIIAVKGIGGFHLACDATSDAPIERLRERKGRVDKPFAVMVADVAQARDVAHVSDDEQRLLTSRARPIVLLRRKPSSPLSKFIAPGNNYLGVLLPYTPLHELLVEQGPLVMTSGNLSDEPIVRTNTEAAERLALIADGFLFHDREIHVACDDAVTRVCRGHELPVRRSRGYAPMPLRLSTTHRNVLAVGGELKSTFCLTKDQYAYLSPHLGDMANLETLDALHRSVGHMTQLFRVVPEIVACDLHPDYLSGRWADEYASTHNIPILKVQHHHAHIASVLAEHGVDADRSAIGVCFDGTGYGPDGTIWGGEFLLASCRHYERRAHLRYTPQPGGDACVQRPCHMALAHLWAAGLPWDDGLPCVASRSEADRTRLSRQLQQNLNCPRTSSMGRLFDAVAALIGIRQFVTYEAQAAIEMEALSAPIQRAQPYTFTISDEAPFVIDPSETLASISHDVVAQIPRGQVIARFHATIAEMIVRICVRIRAEADVHQVAISGGVFQNVLLLQQTVQLLEGLNFDVLYHQRVPPNDGGLALGQAAIAASA